MWSEIHKYVNKWYFVLKIVRFNSNICLPFILYNNLHLVHAFVNIWPCWYFEDLLFFSCSIKSTVHIRVLYSKQGRKLKVYKGVEGWGMERCPSHSEPRYIIDFRADDNYQPYNYPPNLDFGMLCCCGLKNATIGTPWILIGNYIYTYILCQLFFYRSSQYLTSILWIWIFKQMLSS